MSVGDVTAAHPARIDRVLDAQHPYFYLSENTALINPRISTWSGMVTAAGGKLRLQVPWTVKRVRVVTQMYAVEPENVIEAYDDVIEFGYRSATGLAALLDWSRTLASPLDLPGPGDYRLRYHVRASPREAVEPGIERIPMAEALLQLWPSKLGGQEELRITGELGNFWHPGSRLKSVWNG
ncbi:hypothetical protein [Amycolatopsis regifaucium]|uniref:Uncharacterized protein n=1 Tax=Amycolatopsis regifaucium TaxID=546365 RepID=A0A154MQF0_9PSEU|nr:hypothetical protein [Amycolatopsis regifaucium]KZB86506.1 hypothetical protein AVL48_26030 [Amycolatopsis regifaucium]OKA03450.1 hypothetical protein ATP06_0235675 [Amycolatopsis regifaucium]SFJ13090.1 hypothetical protein SAMN04489731_11611 [Amycolatopsis regifaucium]